MKALLRLALAAVVVGFAVPAMAQGVRTDTFQVTAAVRATCIIVSVPDMAFPDYDALTGSDVGQSVNLTIRCNPNTDYEIALDAGSNPAGSTYGTRAMILGGEYLGYDLYTDAGHTDLWGSTTGVGGNTVVGAAPAPPEDVVIPIYGNIPTGQLVTAGTYTDAAVTVTLTF